jgi:hypothetical protein
MWSLSVKRHPASIAACASQRERSRKVALSVPSGMTKSRSGTIP